MLKADCWSCAKLGVEHGPRSNDCPSGDLHFCKRTDETRPKDVCRFWRPSQKWLDHQMWKAGQSTANAEAHGRRSRTVKPLVGDSGEPA
jgi:hypothetical protein